MATIPMGEFAQARAVPRPNTNRVDNSAANRAGAAIANAGQALAGAASDLASIQQRENDAADALALDSDPAFQTVCDARRDGWIAALEADTAAQWAAVVRCGGDALDRAVSL